MTFHDLNQVFDEFAPTPEQEQAMLERLLSEERRTSPMKPVKKTVTVLVAAALLLMACAFTVATGLNQRFLAYFRGTEEDAQQVSGGVVGVGQSFQYENGWTINIEQVLADRYGNVIHLGDRDCSVQRRNQKLIEEAPARCLTPELRERMGAAAVKAAKAVGYENAGTVEFLLDPDREHFYFMEMNTRIQVEHGVTELVTGVDLVRQQLRIASGLALRLRQEDVTLQGHAIECRINAEDPVQGFRPCPGRVDFLHFPGGPGVRVDSCLYSGCELSPYYDSMAAKILAYAPTRMETIRRMRRCLEEFTLEGFPTNAELSYQILYHPEFILGECTTAFLDEHLSELLEFSRKLSESGVDA